MSKIKEEQYSLPNPVLDTLLQRYQEAKQQEQAACLGIDMQIGELNRTFQETMDQLQKRRKEASSEARGQQEDLLAELMPYALALGASYTSSIAKVTVIRPSHRRSWALDGLDSLEMEHPDIWEIIKHMRKVTQVAGKVDVELVPQVSSSEVTRVS